MVFSLAIAPWRAGRSRQGRRPEAGQWSDVRPDVAGERLERGDHAGEIAIAPFEENVADAQGLEPAEVADDLVRRALQRLAIGAARARPKSEARPQGDGELLERTTLPGAFFAQLVQACREAVCRGEGRVPAVRQGDDASERRFGVPAHPDRNVAANRLGIAAYVLEGEEPAVEARARVPPAGAHDPDRLVRPGAALVERCTQKLDLFAHPADARAEDDAAVREVIERGERLGREDRVTMG